MNPSNNHRPPVAALFLALASGAFACLALATVLTVLGVPALEAYVFAGLGGFTISCFVWIERSLIAQCREKERQLALEVTYRQEWQHKLYSRSLACFVRFDAGTLLIDRATPGFIKMLRLPTDTVLRGQRLEEVLGVNPLKLESVVDSIKQGDSSVKQPKVEIQAGDGYTTQALISGQYFLQEHMVEAAFFVPPLKNAERVADLEAAQKDLDAFRKGMFRRETRILELKEEVNTLCQGANLPVRYTTDRSSDDGKLRIPSSKAADAPGRKGLVS
jgi:hypothetical protein